MAIITSSEITLTRVDDGKDGAPGADGKDGEDGFSPTVGTTTTKTYSAITGTIPSEANPAALEYYELINNEYVLTTDTAPVASKTYYTITEISVSIAVTDVNGQQPPVVLESSAPVYNALKDVTVFNQLTSGGALQGVFLNESGHAYFNGQYLRAEGADIGGFSVNSDSIHTRNVPVTSNVDNSVALSSNTNGFQRIIGDTVRSGLKLAIGSNFAVDKAGTLYASNGEFSGDIYGSSLWFGTENGGAGITAIGDNYDGMKIYGPGKVSVTANGGFSINTSTDATVWGEDNGDGARFFMSKGNSSVGGTITMRSGVRDRTYQDGNVINDEYATISLDDTSGLIFELRGTRTYNGTPYPYGASFEMANAHTYMQCDNFVFLTRENNIPSEDVTEKSFVIDNQGIVTIAGDGARYGNVILGTHDSTSLGVNSVTMRMNPSPFGTYIDGDGDASPYLRLRETEKTVLYGYGGDTNGIGVLLEGSGTTVVGAGEAGRNIVLNNVNSSQAGTNESLHLASDNAIYFYSNCQTIANRKQMYLDTNGELHVPGKVYQDAPVALATWGTYSSVNTTITLNSAYTNYRFIVIRFGADAGGSTIGGLSTMVIPTMMMNASNEYQHGWYQGTAYQSIKFTSPTTTQIKITGRTGSASGIRNIYGFN